MNPFLALAHKSIERCRILADHTEESGFITRTFLSDSMRAVHADVRGWMEQAGMSVHVDPAGNIRGVSAGGPKAKRLLIGSHLDTVPHAGAFDGMLGVVMGIAIAELLGNLSGALSIEVIGFSEEEGVRFGTPFIGSRAVIGDLPEDLLRRTDKSGATVIDAISAFGLDPAKLASARADEAAIGYLEFHIEQGPVLESLGLRLGVVEAIAGQSRLTVTFQGAANHAGTTPMHLRRDALAGAAEWVSMVEREAKSTPGLVATVGNIGVMPGAGNVIAGTAQATLDVRHTYDATRLDAVKQMLHCAEQIAGRRGLTVTSVKNLDQAAVPMDPKLTQLMAKAVQESGEDVHPMPSGAGHDAMVMARIMPATMLFMQSPGGLSHHPDESVREQDVAAALKAGLRFFELLEAANG